MNDNSYPNPRIGIIFPASVLVLVGILVLVVSLLRGCFPDRHAGAILADSGRARVHDSISIASALSRVSLAEFGRQAAQARGDSLAAILEALAARSRARPRVRALVPVMPHDTGRTCVADSVLRIVAVGDSACRVEADSLRGSNVEKAFEIEALTERNRELEQRPESCSRWSAFGAGALAGCGVCGGAAAAACVAF